MKSINIILLFSLFILKEGFSQDEGLYDIISGGKSETQYLGSLFFIYLGIFVNILLNVRKGLKTKKQKFSINYWWLHNRIRLISNLFLAPILIYIIIRFSTRFNLQDGMWVPFIIGWGFDRVITNFRGLMNGDIKGFLIRVLGVKNKK